MTHRGPFQPLPFCDSVILWSLHIPSQSSINSFFFFLSPVWINVLLSSSRLSMLYHLPKSYWAAEEMLVFGTLCHPLAPTAVQQFLSISRQRIYRLLNIASCCLYPSQASVHTHVHVCLSRMLRLFEDSPCQWIISPQSFTSCSSNEKYPEASGMGGAIQNAQYWYKAKTPSDFLNLLLIENKWSWRVQIKT